ncbi:MAG: helicase [Devosia sp.]|uniref:helicase-related protein n=1 Tax=Devosia sp. TaxID=1871048 RepID=UPI00261EDE48|nr:helicase-related protein [Devosia sp.]MDB5541149.1 helicase [Devosia sp.]
MTSSYVSSLKAILGPTNTGKTFFAIERMLAHRSGMIGLPLRLLAREVYHKVVDRIGAQYVALVTGEERIVPPKARYWVCTVEAMPLDVPVECVAVDEIQVATDFDRGHVFTNRLLHARGISETLLLGAATMAPLIRSLLPDAEIIYRPRFSELLYAGSKKISRQPKRSAIVAFSASQVYAIAELIRRERGGAAVVMGALSPRTRNAQVDMYQNGDVDFLVATDAIGMGLNLDVHHVAFADDHKFDGHQTRQLTPAEFGQIAGRAGRHMHNGTFGVTGNAPDFDEELIKRLEGHDFEPVRVVQWRNAELDFSSIEDLRASLDQAPKVKVLTRVPVATDQHALEFLARNEAGAAAKGEAAVRLVWECCGIPDYRDISPAQHGEIITRIYLDLTRHGHVDADWIAEQVRFCDNVSGDIDTLSNRIKQIRTWTFVANRKNWLEDPAHWREKTRDIEDRLSDALHERLTQRFVDRRTSVLMRHLRDKHMVSPEINDRGEVSLEGHLIGSIEGFRFTLARSEGGDAKGVAAAASQVVAPEIAKRADRVAGAPNEEFVLATDGYVRWRGQVVANLVEGEQLFTPRLIILADESLSGPDLERVQDRLNLWLRHLVNTQLESVLALEAPADLEGAARGVAYRLYENLGILPRSAVAEEVKGLDQDVRGKLRKLGVKFGAYHIYVPQSLKPAPRELALILYALKHGGVRQPGVSELPHIVLSGRTSFLIDPEVNPKLYELAGFKVAGRRAVRVDILERLADIIRPLIALNPVTHQGELPTGAAEGNGFRVTVEMTSLLGTAGEDFASILNSLGYRVRRTPKVVAAPAVDTASVDTPAEAAPVEAPAEAAATDTPIEAAAVEAASVEAAPVEVAPVAETPADVPAADAEEAAVNAAAADAVEGSAAEATPAAEAATLETATAALGAPAPAEESKPAEPEFDEIWFPAGRRPDNQRHAGPRNRGQRADGAEAPAAEGEKTARPQRNFRRPGPPEGADKGADNKPRPRFEGRRDGQRPNPGAPAKPFENKGKPGGSKRFDKPREDWKEHRPREDRKPAVLDPNSPWAALAALRNPKSE